jgi:chromosome segregation ATPase
MMHETPDLGPNAHLSKREQTEQLLHQYDRMHHDKAHLTHSITEMERGYQHVIDEQHLDLQDAKLQFHNACSAMSSLERRVEALEQDKMQLLVEIEDWKLNCHSKLKKDIQPLDFSNEIQKVADPKAFGILKGLLLELNRYKGEFMALEQNLKDFDGRDSALIEENKKLLNKGKKMAAELKGLTIKVDQLKTQNEFCLGEMEHCQRLNDKLKKQLEKSIGTPPQPPPKNPLGKPSTTNPAVPEPDADQILDTVLKILKIDDKSTLVNSITAIEQAYQYLPSLQSTTEDLYTIVTKNNIFNSNINSYNDLSSCVENWALNLHDYKNLVDGLLETLEISDEQDKTINFILENVKILISREQASRTARVGVGFRDLKDEENFLVIMN